jgi:hypothetical protein
MVPVILLSLFDGIGTAAHILNNMGARTLLYLAWEIDPACISVTAKHHRNVEQRGDFLKDNSHQIAEKILHTSTQTARQS